MQGNRGGGNRHRSGGEGRNKGRGHHDNRMQHDNRHNNRQHDNRNQHDNRGGPQNNRGRNNNQHDIRRNDQHDNRGNHPQRGQDHSNRNMHSKGNRPASGVNNTPVGRQLSTVSNISSITERPDRSGKEDPRQRESKAKPEDRSDKRYGINDVRAKDADRRTGADARKDGTVRPSGNAGGGNQIRNAVENAKRENDRRNDNKTNQRENLDKASRKPSVEIINDTTASKTADPHAKRSKKDNNHSKPDKIVTQTRERALPRERETDRNRTEDKMRERERSRREQMNGERGKDAARVNRNVEQRTHPDRGAAKPAQTSDNKADRKESQRETAKPAPQSDAVKKDPSGSVIASLRNNAGNNPRSNNQDRKDHQRDADKDRAKDEKQGRCRSRSPKRGSKDEPVGPQKAFRNDDRDKRRGESARAGPPRDAAKVIPPKDATTKNGEKGSEKPVSSKVPSKEISKETKGREADRKAATTKEMLQEKLRLKKMEKDTARIGKKDDAKKDARDDAARKKDGVKKDGHKGGAPDSKDIEKKKRSDEEKMRKKNDEHDHRKRKEVFFKQFEALTAFTNKLKEVCDLYDRKYRTNPKTLEDDDIKVYLNELRKLRDEKQIAVDEIGSGYAKKRITILRNVEKSKSSKDWAMGELKKHQDKYAEEERRWKRVTLHEESRLADRHSRLKDQKKREYRDLGLDDLEKFMQDVKKEKIQERDADERGSGGRRDERAREEPSRTCMEGTFEFRPNQMLDMSALYFGQDPSQMKTDGTPEGRRRVDEIKAVAKLVKEEEAEHIQMISSLDEADGEAANKVLRWPYMKYGGYPDPEAVEEAKKAEAKKAPKKVVGKKKAVIKKKRVKRGGVAYLMFTEELAK